MIQLRVSMPTFMQQLPVMRRFVFGLTAMLVVVTGCASDPLTRSVVNKPESRVYEMNSSVVLKAAKKVLQRKKFNLDVERSNAQHLATEWLEEGFYRSKIEAGIRALSIYSSELTVQIFLEKKKTLKKTWQAVDKIGDRTYYEFFDEIQLECYRVMYDGG